MHSRDKVPRGASGADRTLLWVFEHPLQSFFVGYIGWRPAIASGVPALNQAQRRARLALWVSLKRKPLRAFCPRATAAPGSGCRLGRMEQCAVPPIGVSSTLTTRSNARESPWTNSR
jgi:hypothetical protein